MEIQDLPLLNASLNGLATFFIVVGLFSIKSGNVSLHKKCMFSAILVSAAFLTSYLIYHFNVTSVTRFSHGGWPRNVYYFILFTHIPLAVAVLPLLWMTVRPAWQGDYPRHKRWAKLTVPVWLYVSVTGVLVYLMLYVWFPSSPVSWTTPPGMIP